MTTNKQEQKEARTYYLKKSTIDKIEKMAREQNRKFSAVLDLLVEAA